MGSRSRKLVERSVWGSHCRLEDATFVEEVAVLGIQKSPLKFLGGQRVPNDVSWGLARVDEKLSIVYLAALSFAKLLKQQWVRRSGTETRPFYANGIWEQRVQETLVHDLTTTMP
ncbi:hypothetical protein RUND412_006489 [Rhizina undulata]